MAKIKKKVEKPLQDSPWKARLMRMKRYKEKNSADWARNRKLIFGETEGESKENVFSFGWSLVKSLETAIYVQNPEMMVEPYDGTKKEIGSLLTAIANYDLDQMDLKSIGNLGLIDCFINGFFACIETIETEKETVRYPSGEEDERPSDQRFCAYRISPKDILFDPKGRLLDLSDHRWVAVAFYPTVSDLKADKKTFPNLPSDIEDYPEASPEKPPAGQRDSRGSNLSTQPGGEKDPEYKTICIWEIHDRIKQEIVYVTDHKEKEVGTIPWPVKFKIGGRTLYPITLMAFHQMPDKFWPKAEIDLIANQLVKLNELDRQIYQDALEKWRKYVTIEGLVSTDQLAKVTDTSAPNAVITIQREDLERLAGNPNSPYPDVDHLFGEVKDPSVKKDMIAVREMCKQEIMDIVGYGPPDRGGMPKTRSAREAVAIKEKLEARLAKRSDAVADFYRLFGQKHLMALQQRMVVDRYTKVFPAAKAGLSEYKKYAKEDIDSGLFDFIVFAGTSAPRNTEAKRNSEIQLYQTLAPAAQVGKIPWEPLVLRLAEAFQWRGVDALLKNYKPATVALAKLLFAANTGKVPPQALPEAAAAVVQAVLTPEELQLIAKEIQGQGSAPGPSMEPQQSRGNPDEAGTGAVS